MAHWLYCQSCNQWSKFFTTLSKELYCPFCNSPLINSENQYRDIPPVVPKQSIVQLNVAASASLADVLPELERIYCEIDPNININFTFAVSRALVRQIESGQPYDLFISSANSPMDGLQQKGLIDENSRKNLLSNTLVLIAPSNSTLESLYGLTDASVKKVALADPEIMPAGYYARQTLISMGLWDELEPKLVHEDDVLTNAGFVYRSDTYQVPGIQIIESAPPGSHDPIIYPMAIVSASCNKTAAQKFADFLITDRASEIFTKHYFIPLNLQQIQTASADPEPVLLNPVEAADLTDTVPELEEIPEGIAILTEPVNTLPEMADQGAGSSDIGARLDKIEAMLLQLLLNGYSAAQKEDLDLMEPEAMEEIAQPAKYQRKPSKLLNKSGKKGKGTRKYR